MPTDGVQEEYSVKTGWNRNSWDIAQLAKALNQCQSEVLGAKKSSDNPFHKSRYADLASVWEAIRTPLTKNGLSVVQMPCEAPAGHVGLLTVLLHTSGQSVSDKFFMPVKDASNPQAVGSALTYARRYALSAVVGVCPEDDDGNAAMASPKPQRPGLAKAIAPPPPLESTLDQKFIQQFMAANTDQDKKQVYAAVRNSSVPEPRKSELLTYMSEVIRSGRAGEGKK